MGKIIVDSDLLVACFKHDDFSHQRAVLLAKKIHQDNQFVVLNLVIQESTTVISKHMGMNDARNYYRHIPDIIDHVIQVDEYIERLAWDIFLQQTKKGCSFVDCANLAVIEKYSLDGILSFDAFYPKRLRKT